MNESVGDPDNKRASKLGALQVVQNNKKNT